MSLTKDHITLPIPDEDETSDTLSTGVTSPSSYSLPGNNLFSQQPFDEYNGDAIYADTKKIRKKRTAYQRVDDDIRLQLLEAVNQNGETLKSAAKKLKINYSTAKSILHTYRKEGRILKKVVVEKPLQFFQFEPTKMEISPMNCIPQLVNENFSSQRNTFSETLKAYEFQPRPNIPSVTVVNENRPPSPMRGLTENFNHLVLGQQQVTKELNIPKPQIPSFSSQLRDTRIPLTEISPYNSQQNSACPQIPALNVNSNSTPKNPLESLKKLDNFYMNYSNSPLSGGANLFKDCSDSGSRSRCYQKEFDSFSDMITAFQNQNRNGDDMKNGIHIPKPLRFSGTPVLQERTEGKKIKEDGYDWDCTLENAARDTIKSFMDAQLLLCGALKKASYLNNLVQITGVSPTNNWNK